ncbi:MAG TPA: tetratricopeptide repeat protein [Candidatus Polarisedimenticolaceae bacterium]|nr:tetratricopeptide repeat protein [Candidatus Polarisedimenticolaceae bacterium]
MTKKTQSNVALLTALLVVATLAVYAQTAGASFITADDGVYVTANPTVQAGLTGPGLKWAFGFRDANWIPLTWLSLMLDATLGGTGPRLFHLTNVLLHLASTLLLFLALTRMTGRTGRSWCVALLFAVHPLHVESVAWVAERKDTLSGLFFMLGLVAWSAYVRRPRAGRYALAALALALGLMAKPMLVTFPLVLLLLDLWPLARPLAPKRLLLEKLPLFGLAAISGALTVAAQSGGGTVSGLEAIPLSERAGNAVVSYAAYLVKAVVPTGLAFFYPHPGGRLPAWEVLGSAALLAAITIVAFRSIRTRPYLAIGWAWYAIMLVPVIGIVQVGIQARADRYTYLPLIGIFLAATWAFAELAEGRLGLQRAAAAAAGLALTAAAYVEAGYWHDSVTLYRRALAVTQDNVVAHNDLGLALLQQNDLEGAIRESREAIRLDPGHPEPANTLATALTRLGRPQEAIAAYRTALAHRPSDAVLHGNLGTVLAETGDLDGARTEFQTALRIAPDSSDAHYNVGILLAREGRYDEAIAELVIAQRLSPFDPEIRQSLDAARAASRK